MAQQFKIIEQGNPYAFIGKDAPEGEEAEKLRIRTGEPQAEEPRYWLKKPTGFEGPTDRVLYNIERKEYWSWDFAEGRGYDQLGRKLSDADNQAMLDSGLVPHGSTLDRDSFTKLVAEVEQIPEEEVVIVDVEEADDEER